MSDQKKPKIDLKARLGKKTVAAPTGPAIPPPVGIPKPPAMAGGGFRSASQPPPPGHPYAAASPSAPPPPPPRVEPQAIKVEMSEEVVAEQAKQKKRGYMISAVIGVITMGIGFAWGGRAEANKGANAALEGAKTLIKDIEAADKVADDLNSVLAKASERLSKNEYPDEEISKLGGINIPFDGTHLDKSLGRFPKSLVSTIITYANTAQKANDQKEKIQSLLSGSKAALQDVLTQKTDPKVRWAVWLESGPGGPWMNMQPVTSPFLVKSTAKVKDKDGKEKDYEWPAEITVVKGKDSGSVKRYKSGDISSGDPQWLPVNPATESMVCPSTTIVRLRSELQEMQTVLKGDQTPGQEKDGFLQMGETVVAQLKKIGTG
ncbi:MAG TPA: hypothetical protein VHE30_13315 [Polyangiaceae bacterium]|nr:hypothetical protein [Polyangiaceae bacterium]